MAACMTERPREISFAMGRPDTLGADPYHNRRFPLVRGEDDSHHAHHQHTSAEPPDLLDPPFCAIIEAMVHFSRITRKVCLGIYLQDAPTPGTVALANQIERELDAWVDSLPRPIRPRIGSSPGQPETLKSARQAQWVKRQKLVLHIRRFLQTAHRAGAYPVHFVSRATRRLTCNHRIPQPPDPAVRVPARHVDAGRAGAHPPVRRGHPEMHRRRQADHPGHLRDVPAPRLLPHLVTSTLPRGPYPSFLSSTCLPSHNVSTNATTYPGSTTRPTPSSPRPSSWSTSRRRRAGAGPGPAGAPTRRQRC